MPMSRTRPKFKTGATNDYTVDKAATQPYPFPPGALSRSLPSQALC
jgi:hypothetical protein